MSAQVLTTHLEDLTLAALALRQGQCVAIPTETVYGLAADATQPEAVLRVFEAKQRPQFDPLIVHTLATTVTELIDQKLVTLSGAHANYQRTIEALIQQYWPGPLTLLLPRDKQTIPDLVCSGLDLVAVRSPAHPIARQILMLTERPLAAPSANRFGRISPTLASHVQSELGTEIRWIVDGGPCSLGIESTILWVDPRLESPAQILRPGGLDLFELKKFLEALGIRTASAVGTSANRLAAPGTLPSHYAPAKGLSLFNSLKQLTESDPGDPGSIRALGFLFWDGNEDARRAEIAQAFPKARSIEIRILSASADVNEAARKLFADLRALDTSQAELLFAQRIPDDVRARSGIALAIEDRLERAAHPLKQVLPNSPEVS